MPTLPRLLDRLPIVRRLREAEATARRYSLHLDDIRNDLADAGIAIPSDDDPETTPRRMVGALIRDRNGWRKRAQEAEIRDAFGDRELAALHAERDNLRSQLTARQSRVRAVSGERRFGILRAVDPVEAMTAEHIATRLVVEARGEEWHPLHGLSLKTVINLIGQLAAEGFLSHDGKRERRYTLTDKGRAELAPKAAPTICDSCEHDFVGNNLGARGCRIICDENAGTDIYGDVYEWVSENCTGPNGDIPRPGSPPCPGHSPRPTADQRSAS